MGLIENLSETRTSAKKHANTEVEFISAVKLKHGGLLGVNSHQLETFDAHKDGRSHLVVLAPGFLTSLKVKR